MTEHKESPEMAQQPPTPVENKTAGPGAANAPAAAQPAAAPSPQRMDPVRKWVLVFTAFCLVLFLWYLAGDRFTPFTTQARVNAWVVPVASQVSGRILSIEVRTDEKVKKDQLLAQIDPEDFRVAVAGAEAQLALTKENLEAESAAVISAAAAVKSAPLNKISVIGITPKNGPPFDPSYDDVMQRSGRIQSGFTWHGSSITVSSAPV